MKKIIFFVLTGAILAINAISAQPSHGSYTSNEAYGASQINWQTDFESARAAARSSSKPLVLLFTGTDWCPACQQLERNVLTKSEFARLVADKFVFFKAEISKFNSDAYRSLRDQYQIRSYPTMLVANADGQVLYTIPYQNAGPDAYANQLLSRLNQAQTNTASTPTYSY